MPLLERGQLHSQRGVLLLRAMRLRFQILQVLAGRFERTLENVTSSSRSSKVRSNPRQLLLSRVEIFHSLILCGLCRDGSVDLSGDRIDFSLP